MFGSQQGGPARVGAFPVDAAREILRRSPMGTPELDWMTRWRTCNPAMTTPFRTDLSVDHQALAHHVSWLIDSGCKAIVPLGSLGESAPEQFSQRLAARIPSTPSWFRSIKAAQ